jgi:hypothetical protein
MFAFFRFESWQRYGAWAGKPLRNKLIKKEYLTMSHRMKMNEDIITPASPSGDPKLFKSHSPGAFLAPHQAGSIADGNACSRCFCLQRVVNQQTTDTPDY